MGRMIDRRRVMGGKKGLLPNGYKQLEYIESTGTQYLQGNISELTDSAEIKIDVYSYNFRYDAGFFGLYNSTTNIRSFFTGYGFENSIYVSSYPVQKYTVAPGTAVTGDHTIERKSNGDIYVDGSKITDVLNDVSLSPFANMTSFVVCRTSLFTIILPARYKRITIKNKLDLVPAKNSSNVVGMYDLVSGQFFTNAGTGDFIAGPEV